MLIKISHPEYEAAELTAGKLKLYGPEGAGKELGAQIQDFALTAVSNQLHIVAFQKSNWAWHYRGQKPLFREQLELSSIYHGGGRLIADAQGQAHLFYFAKQASGSGPALRHQIYDGRWSPPFLAAANSRLDFSVLGNEDYLYLVYCQQQAGHLLYRAFDLNKRIWSGTVVLRAGDCRHPQLIPGPQLRLFWLEGKEESAVLNFKAKNNTWSSGQALSSQAGRASRIGYTCQEECGVFWLEAGNLYYLNIDSQSGPQLLPLEDYHFQERAAAMPGWGSFLLAGWELKKAKKTDPGPAETEAVPAEEEEPEVQPKSDLERGMASLFEEWAQFKAEIGSWQKSIVLPKIPPAPDLTPWRNRLERLESRLAVNERKLEREKISWKEETEKLKSRVTQLERRLQEIETRPESRTASIWRRVIPKD
ncbi:MAG: hypothetical protein GX335_02530 [Firmicutes bacterium]|nr:hypothetical protein [Bacillota bacterium]